MCGGWKEGTEWGLHQAPHLGGWDSLQSRCFLPHCTLRNPLFAPSLSQYFSHEPVSFPSCSQHHPGTSFLFLERWQRGSSPWSCEDPLHLPRHLRGSSSSSWRCGSGRHAALGGRERGGGWVAPPLPPVQLCVPGDDWSCLAAFHTVRP